MPARRVGSHREPCSWAAAAVERALGVAPKDALQIRQPAPDCSAADDVALLAVGTGDVDASLAALAFLIVEQHVFNALVLEPDLVTVGLGAKVMGVAERPGALLGVGGI